MFKWIARIALRGLKNNRSKYQRKLVSAINSKIDIPRMTEKEEQKLFNAVIDAIVEILL